MSNSPSDMLSVYICLHLGRYSMCVFVCLHDCVSVENCWIINKVVKMTTRQRKCSFTFISDSVSSSLSQALYHWWETGSHMVQSPTLKDNKSPRHGYQRTDHVKYLTQSGFKNQRHTENTHYILFIFTSYFLNNVLGFDAVFSLIWLLFDYWYYWYYYWYYCLII